MDKEIFTKYDNIDKEVIEISRDSLLLRLESCIKYAVIPSQIAGSGSLALTFLLTAFLTEKFYNIWSIPGETIRSFLMVGGIAAFSFTAYQVYRWHGVKGDYTPSAIVNSLTVKVAKPVALISAPTQIPTQKPRRVRASNEVVA